MNSISTLLGPIFCLLMALFTPSGHLSAQDVELGTYSRWGFGASKTLTDDLRKMYPAEFAKGKIAYLSAMELTDKAGTGFVVVKLQRTHKKTTQTYLLTATNRNGVLWHIAGGDCLMSCLSETCTLDILQKCRNVQCTAPDPQAPCGGSRIIFRQ